MLGAVGVVYEWKDCFGGISDAFISIRYEGTILPIESGIRIEKVLKEPLPGLN